VSDRAPTREVRDALAAIIGGDAASSVDENDLIFEEGVIDSLHLIELIDLLQERFGMEVESDELSPENFESLQAMADYVRRKRGSQHLDRGRDAR
jgi:acyl carrier protein